eukprot:CAMPEP_0201539970 /NCGR_PEP_ID=MMETSP0161_2-20130828/70685_1 /ASSEMBLY_ACC=CAM_ASM_000251 /TAXON_ID=180227 /ORGANISM="Neoparamoeba aestuarina, Strain SoJaBio B1-5/56/2" /LENGTH=251 /DNA_ID=CAMNT_0047947401 /DNA_START=1845 /DNA_END=2600 /DNA_ORIENTATION=+
MVQFDRLDEENCEIEGDKAVFELHHVEKEWHIRPNETMMFELRLDGETLESQTKKAACCSLFCSVIIPIFLPFQLCQMPALLKQGKTLADTKIFLTDQAIYCYSGERDEHTRLDEMKCACPCFGCEGYPVRQRIEYNQIGKAVSNEIPGSCLAPEANGYYPLQIQTVDALRIISVNQHGSVVGDGIRDPKGIYYARVYHANDVVKMINFICEAKANDQDIDWNSLKKSMKKYVTVIEDKSNPRYSANSMEE